MESTGWLSSHLFDPAVRKITRLGASVAGSLIQDVHRRRRLEPRRTPGNLLVEDAFGFPGLALADLDPYPDPPLVPLEISADQAKDFARAAGRVVLEAGAGRMRELARANLRDLPHALTERWRRPPERQAPEPTSSPPEQVAARAAWDRFITAFDTVEEQRSAYQSSPSDLTAEELVWAEVELEDAVAVAGEFQVHNLRWILT